MKFNRGQGGGEGGTAASSQGLPHRVRQQSGRGKESAHLKENIEEAKRGCDWGNPGRRGGGDCEFCHSLPHFQGRVVFCAMSDRASLLAGFLFVLSGGSLSPTCQVSV